MFQALIRLFCSELRRQVTFTDIYQGIMAAGVLPRPGYESLLMGSVPATLFHGRKRNITCMKHVTKPLGPRHLINCSPERP